MTKKEIKKIIDDIELLHSRHITDESGYNVVLIPRIYWRRLLEATKEKTKRYKNRKEK